MSERPAGLTAPFTPEQAGLLNRFQSSSYFPPFTCGRRDAHPDNEGVLKATVEGWICPVSSCGYTQGWAHWFMADPDWLNAMEKRQREMFTDFKPPSD